MIRFSRYIWLYALISAIVLVPGMYSFVLWGLKPAVDFAGGTLVELKLDEKSSQAVVETAAKNAGLTVSSIQSTAEKTYILRTTTEADTGIALMLKDFEEASRSPAIIRSETVGPVLGRELLQKAVIAALFAITCILLYVAFAFKNVIYGISAIAALIHDLLVVLGCFSLFGHFWGVEVDTLFVTAFLTTMSFSVHDTIVVFDRIRENQRKDGGADFEATCDRALMETMGRSLANSMTIMYMLLALVLMGGSATLWFAVALLIGTISGTYSSDFVATPVLILLHRWKNRKRKI